MPVVTFMPAARSVEIAEGTSLLDAATRAGVTIVAPCGGEGVCGECRVRVISGSVERAPRGCLSPEERAEGWVLACSSRVVEDATVHVTPAAADRPATVAGDHPPATTAAQTAIQPLAGKYFVTVAPPSLDNSFSDFDRLVQAVRASSGVANVTASLPVLRELAAALRASEGHVTATIDTGDAGTPAEIVRIEPGDTTNTQVGLAIDVGTTTCAVSLVDLTSGHTLGTAADYNGQLARGADIISRINYAKTPERLDELRQLVLGTINALIEQLCAEHALTATQIDNAVVAGNTTMLHLLLGLPPEHIRLAPYTPTVNQPPRLRGRAVGLATNPEAYVLFAPGVGSYVGGDITAGLLQTAVTDSDDVRLFLDIGTNGEVVVGNREWLMACAASAGPAFEGSGVSCGMRADAGAIERVRIDPATGQADVTVIGGGAPRGICGSGMIDLLAELWSGGLLDPSGKLDASRGHGRIAPVADGGRNAAYTVVAPERTHDGRALVIDEHDIQNLMRTKAAVYSACAVMLNAAGIGFDAIAEVLVAGGFGRFLDLEKSIAIGLLPDLPLERYTYLGNSALSGARLMLCSAAARAQVRRLADRITYLELNVDPAYMSEYTAALFLPHTDLDRFPTVRVAVAARRKT